MSDDKTDPQRFSAEEIIEVVSGDFVELVTSLGEVDMTSPQHVYDDTKRIMDKLSDDVATKARDVAERKTD